MLQVWWGCPASGTSFSLRYALQPKTAGHTTLAALSADGTSADTAPTLKHGVWHTDLSHILVNPGLPPPNAAAAVVFTKHLYPCLHACGPCSHRLWPRKGSHRAEAHSDGSMCMHHMHTASGIAMSPAPRSPTARRAGITATLTPPSAECDRARACSWPGYHALRLRRRV